MQILGYEVTFSTDKSVYFRALCQLIVFTRQRAPAFEPWLSEESGLWITVSAESSAENRHRCLVAYLVLSCKIAFPKEVRYDGNLYM